MDWIWLGLCKFAISNLNCFHKFKYCNHLKGCSDVNVVVLRIIILFIDLMYVCSADCSI